MHAIVYFLFCLVADASSLKFLALDEKKTEKHAQFFSESGEPKVRSSCMYVAFAKKNDIPTGEILSVFYVCTYCVDHHLRG